MSEQPPATKRAAPRRRNVGRMLGNIAVAIVILAVMAGAFALSYTPVRDIARDAGVARPVVRIYPGILDAVFLICCACALMLRNARWWTRLYAWLSVLVTGALIGAAGVYHATGLRLPRRTLDGTVWALPWALVLLAFSLWISTLQHTKSDRDPRTPEPDDRTSEPDEQAAPDAQVLALEATPSARVALPAPEAQPDEASATRPVAAGSRAARAGGLAEVGLGRPAEARAVAPAEADAGRVAQAAEGVEKPPGRNGPRDPGAARGRADPWSEGLLSCGGSRGRRRPRRASRAIEPADGPASHRRCGVTRPRGGDRGAEGVGVGLRQGLKRPPWYRAAQETGEAVESELSGELLETAGRLR